jgi:hypothetical protein
MIFCLFICFRSSLIFEAMNPQLFKFLNFESFQAIQRIESLIPYFFLSIIKTTPVIAIKPPMT